MEAIVCYFEKINDEWVPRSKVTETETVDELYDSLSIATELFDTVFLVDVIENIED